MGEEIAKMSVDDIKQAVKEEDDQKNGIPSQTVASTSAR